MLLLLLRYWGHGLFALCVLLLWGDNIYEIKFENLLYICESDLGLIHTNSHTSILIIQGQKQQTL